MTRDTGSSHRKRFQNEEREVEQSIRLLLDRESGEERRKCYRLGYVLEGGSGVWVKHFDSEHTSVELGDVIQAETEKGAALARLHKSVTVQARI